MKSAAKPRRTVESIQVLRGVAACLVVLHHSSQWMKPSGEPAYLTNWGNLLDFGIVGVDIFFAISGFIMVMITDHSLPSERQPGKFLLDRAVRIMPLYWIYTTCMLLLLPFRSKHYSPAFILRSYLFIEAPYPLLGQGWTLTYELLFYLVFALLIRMDLVYATCWMTAVFALLAGLRVVLPDQGPLFEMLTDPISLEFCLGMVAGLIYTRVRELPRLPLQLLLAVSTVALGAAAVYPCDPQFRVLCWGLPAFGIVCAASLLERSQPIQPHGMLLALGNASYSIYLVHMFPLAVINPLLYRLGLVGRVNMDVLIVLQAALCVIPGVIAYRLVELPLTEKLRQLTGRRRQLAVAK